MQNIKVSVRSREICKVYQIRPRRGSYNHFEIAKDKRWYMVATGRELMVGHKNTQMVRQNI